MRSAPAQQWIATILSAKGIREDEIDRSGLLLFLDELNGSKKITKDKLLEIAENQLIGCHITIKTERSISYIPALESASFTADTIPQKVLDSFTDAEIISCHKLVSFNYRIVRLKFTSLFGTTENWVVFDQNWHRFKPLKDYENPVDAADFLYTMAKDKFSGYSSKTPFNIYERYSLLGKNNSYKEWIVCVPYWHDGFEQSHFDLMNVILHLRTSEWKDTNNNPLLLIDEMQSDWHSLGREHGYYEINEDFNPNDTDMVPDAPFKKEWYELGVKIAIWIAHQSGHQRVAFTTGNTQKVRYGNDLDGFHLLYDQLIPKALSKLVTKFNCKLDRAMIEVSNPTHTIRYKKDVGWELRNKNVSERIQIVKNKVVAMQFLKARGQKKKEELRVLEISHQINELVKTKGIPLFGWW